MLCVFGLAYNANSQCSVSSAPNSNCNYNFNISAFSLNSITSTGNGGCGSGGYNNFATPVRALTMGQTYPYSVTFASSYYAMGFAIWIDLNGDLQFNNTEMLAVQPFNYGSGYTGNITIPFTATPGTGRKMRIRHCDYTTPTGNDACTSYLGYYGEIEDYLVDIIAPPPCSGSVAATSVVTPTYQICPNSATTVSLATTYTNYGYTYQWQMSTVSAVGPWTTISGANLPSYTTPTLSGSVYYSAIVTCTNGNNFTTASAGQVTVVTVTTSNVPYYEGFENIAFNNQLPNCSWAATNMPSVTRTYTSTLNANRSARTGSRYASFYSYYINGSNYFYTNGIQLNAGVTYSAALWFQTEYYGYTNVTNLSILYGTTQSTTGLVTIASQSPAASPVYKSLSNTFTVPTSGLYYIAVKATSNGSYGTQYLSWDDLSITVPCSLNQSTISLSASQTTICNGQSISITAAGADTYTWNTGANGSTISDTPGASFTYSVMGTNTLTGCTFSQLQTVIVNNAPNVVIFADAPQACPGTPVHLTASGAGSYTWTNGSNAGLITVSPTVSTVYSVLGANANCTSAASLQVLVYPQPTVTASSSAPTQMCAGETQMLTGGGSNIVTYQWAANTLFIQAPVAFISPNVTTTYTLTGVDANGCTAKTTLVQVVDACVGLNEVNATLSGVKIYPNPTAGLFTVELNGNVNKAIEVMDVTGRVVLVNTAKDGKVNVNISALANGVYYVKIQSGNGVEVIKVVKQ